MILLDPVLRATGDQGAVPPNIDWTRPYRCTRERPAREPVALDSEQAFVMQALPEA
jgi:hypothetical protein